MLTPDPKFDVPLLKAALRTPAHYIGVMGSRRTNEDRRTRLRELGMSDEELARMHGPDRAGPRRTHPGRDGRLDRGRAHPGTPGRFGTAAQPDQGPHPHRMSRVMPEFAPDALCTAAPGSASHDALNLLANWAAKLDRVETARAMDGP